jgi:transposase
MVMAAVEAAGARVIPMPPSSPDLTPIEQMFSKVKGALRSEAARTTEAVTAAIGTPCMTFPPKASRGGSSPERRMHFNREAI